MNVDDTKTGTILKFTGAGIEKYSSPINVASRKCGGWRWRVVDLLTEYPSLLRLERLDTKNKKIEVWSTNWLPYMEEDKGYKGGLSK